MASANDSKPTTEPVYPTPVPATETDEEKQQSKHQSNPSFTDNIKLGFASIQSKFQRNNGNSQSDSRLAMSGLLKQARISFEKWVAIEKPFNYPTPNGIVFLTSVKGSFGWGGELSTGVVFYRKNKSNQNNNNSSNDDEKENNNNNNVEWSGPCAIGSGGVSFGLQIGISKINHIIMLPQRHHVRTFTSKGQLKLGGSTELTVVNAGLKAQGSVNISNKEISDIHSYSLDTKGLSIGISVEGAVISIRNDCNKNFYGKSVTAQDIADGNVTIPNNIINEDYNKIVEILNKHFKIRARPMHHGGPHGPPFIAPIIGHGPFGGPHGPHGPHFGGPGPHGGGRGGGPLFPLVGAVLGTAAVVAATRPPPRSEQQMEAQEQGQQAVDSVVSSNVNSNDNNNGKLAQNEKTDASNSQIEGQPPLSNENANGNTFTNDENFD